jgi:hypothetical protein
MNSRDRILQFVEYKQISKNVFYKKVGLSNGFLDKNNHPRADKIEQIIYAYPEISPEWLLTGKGAMLRDTAPSLESTKGSDTEIATLHARIAKFEAELAQRPRAGMASRNTAPVLVLAKNDGYKEKYVELLENHTKVQEELVVTIKALRDLQKFFAPFQDAAALVATG